MRSWQSPDYYLGKYYDAISKQESEIKSRQVGRTLQASKWSSYAVSAYGKALAHGTKFLYQALPRLLTIWLDIGAQGEVIASSASSSTTDRRECVGDAAQCALTVIAGSQRAASV